MQIKHINHDKTKLLIFFGGFYTDFHCFEEFDKKTTDILFVYDYSSMDTDELLNFDYTMYSEINLAAYSYGVWASNYCFKKKCLPSLNESIAVSGTFYPVNDELGIPLKIYDIMLNALSPKIKRSQTLWPNANAAESNQESDQSIIKNFERKMAIGSSGEMKKAQRTLENLYLELKNIKEISLNEPTKSSDCNLPYDRIILTSKDKIVPFRAQSAFWQNHPYKTILDSGHFPFFEDEMEFLWDL